MTAKALYPPAPGTFRTSLKTVFFLCCRAHKEILGFLAAFCKQGEWSWNQEAYSSSSKERETIHTSATADKYRRKVDGKKKKSLNRKYSLWSAIPEQFHTFHNFLLRDRMKKVVALQHSTLGRSCSTQSCTNVHVTIPHALCHPCAWFLPERHKYIMAARISAVVSVFYQAMGRCCTASPTFILSQAVEGKLNGIFQVHFHYGFRTWKVFIV